MSIALVTGANKGLGFETARQNAEPGHDDTIHAAAAPLGPDGPAGTSIDGEGSAPW